MPEDILRAVHALPRLIRARQWSKNLFLFAALVFSRNLFDMRLLLLTVAGFIAFSLASSTVYIINDLRDREEDRLHPEKRSRPIASGVIGVPAAIAVAMCTLLGAILISTLLLSHLFNILLAAYLAIQTAYSFGAKRVVILDCLIIAIGFVIRVIAGAMIIDVPVSSWLLLCTFFLALFLAFCKRFNELATLEEAYNHRHVLKEYSLPFLTQMITTSTSATILSYALYVTSPVTIRKFHSPYLAVTVPFVLFGVFRYLYLLHRREMGGNPTDILFSDAPFFANLLLWISTSILIVYTAAL